MPHTCPRPEAAPLPLLAPCPASPSRESLNRTELAELDGDPSSLPAPLSPPPLPPLLPLSSSKADPMESVTSTIASGCDRCVRGGGRGETKIGNPAATRGPQEDNNSTAASARQRQQHASPSVPSNDFPIYLILITLIPGININYD